MDLCKQYQKLKAPVDAAVARVLQSGRYVLGPEVQAFESELAAHLQVKDGTLKVVGVGSGTDALLASAMALRIGLGCGREPLTTSMPMEAEVVTSAYSFFATPETAVRLGARPVFADIEEDGFNADIDDLLSKVSPRTAAILPVHLFGKRMAVDRLVATGLPVIEDAAQTLVPGIATEARCATLSFFPSKNLGAAGDAGAIVTSDPALFDELIAIRQHGSRPKYVHSLWGGNFRMDPIQAAILRVKLGHLNDWQAQRRRNAARYHAALEKHAKREALRLPPSPDEPAGAEHVYHHYVVRVLGNRRDALRAFLGERGVETEVYYPLPLHLQPCFAHLGYRAGSCPRAEAAALEALALPVHPDLDDEQIDHVIESIDAFYRS